MLAHRIIRDRGDGDAVIVPRAGWVLARGVSSADADRGFAKGHILQEADVTRLLTMPWRELHVVEPEPGEIHEAEAGLRIAQASAGQGVEVGALGGGHWPLTAAQRGLLRVSVEALTRLNDIPGACVYTRFDGQVVDAGTVVARAKVTPLLLARDAVEKAEQVAQSVGGLVQVAPFAPMTVGVVVQETLDAGAAARFATGLSEKLAWFGSRLLPPVFVAPADVAIAEAVAGVVAAGGTVVLMVGTRALDPLDPAFVALRAIGVDLDRFGVPVHPGSLSWIGHWQARTFVGVPTCGLFSQLTSFDLILPRLLAGEELNAHALSRLAHGGLLAGANRESRQ